MEVFQFLLEKQIYEFSLNIVIHSKYLMINHQIIIL